MKKSTGLAVDPFINKNQKFGKRFLCYFLFQHTSRKKVADGVPPGGLYFFKFIYITFDDYDFRLVTV